MINPRYQFIEQLYGVLFTVLTPFYAPFSRSFATKNELLFIHCESNGISSRVSVYLITEGVSH